LETLSKQAVQFRRIKNATPSHSSILKWIHSRKNGSISIDRISGVFEIQKTNFEGNPFQSIGLLGSVIEIGSFEHFDRLGSDLNISNGKGPTSHGPRWSECGSIRGPGSQFGKLHQP